jgi:IS30 family transposase
VDATYDATGLTAPQRDELIVRLRRKGYTYRKIGRAVGMSPQGVLQALRRMADPAPLEKARSQALRQGRDPRA